MSKIVAPEQLRPVDFVIRRDTPITSSVFDSYWHFACERQKIYFARINGSPRPWTTDKIIQTYRFTNAYRAADRVSQYLIRHVIHSDKRDLEVNDLLFRVLLFKMFNKIETWQLLERNLGRLSWDTYKFHAYDSVLSKAMDAGTRIYSAAYIMPACAAMSSGDRRKHRSHLRLIEHMIASGLANRLIDAKRMEDAFLILRGFPMLGDFLSYQFLIDVNYSPLTSFDESEFVVPGPGAREGLRKVFLNPGGLSDSDLIRWVTDRQEEEFARRALSFQSLWGRRLQLIDCQNLFCEIGKYARVRHPEFTGTSGRARIKQKFEDAGALPVPLFPPKWGLNEKIARSVKTSAAAVRDNLFEPISEAGAV